MARRPHNNTIDFADIASTIGDTRNGQEASMYPHLFDLFVHFLGYGRRQVFVDTAGDAGRPDLACKAPSGLTLANGRPFEIDWIVVEAKDGRTNLANADAREALFAEKSKYITPNTAWFVMVNPSLFVARPVMSGDYNALGDIEFSFHGESEADFRRKFAPLHRAVAGVPDRLRRFRDGDVSLIATEKLMAPEGAEKRMVNRVQLARRNFYSTLRDTTRGLQEATLHTLRSLQGDVQEIAAAVAEFDRQYGPYEFNAHTLTIKGNPRLEQRGYGADVARLNRKLRKAGSIARLAIVGWPQFRARISVKNDAAGERQALEMFATETANLVLARILLIRFFEDHGFFGEHRYLCNGGVAAFQQLREIFEQGYTRLLKMAYEKAQALYAAAFDETELDWVFDAHDERLSAAIEWAMFQLSRYDFTTVKGDILTGIYDRFLDRDQRKKFGEYYTPPSIARYIVDRLDLAPGDRFLDPACGSGTFLIERFQQLEGEAIDQGVGSYPRAVAALESLAGNDLNTFSAVLAQIQLLWHILVFRDELLAAEDFPDIAISEKASSIVAHDAEEGLPGRWAELDRLEYGGVGGNPPYVRPERGGEVSPATRQYFEHSRDFVGGGKSWPGISAEANLYALFIYRALTDWCSQPNRWGEGAGRMGYVVPLALCGTNENAALRRLLAPGGRWTIKEIVDLEVIWRHVFDADVLPMLLIVEARPPRMPIEPELLNPDAPLPEDPVRRLQVRAARLQPVLDEKAGMAGPRQAQWQALAERNRARWEPDRVTIRLADKSVIDFHEGGKRPTFRLYDAETVTAAYADIFTPDGRLITRVTPERRTILAKLHANSTLTRAAQTYWFKRSGTNRGTVQLDPPTRELDRWEQREMIGAGLAWRGARADAAPGAGVPVYKGENVLAGGLHGTPDHHNADIQAADDLGLFRLGPLLPSRIYAIAQIERCPNATPFDPAAMAFTNTATLFAPRTDLANVPFDLLFVSRVYRYFYALAGRMSYLNLMRSHIYPRNLRLLPWNDALALTAQPLEALRPAFVEACANAFRTEEQMFAELERLPLKTLRDAVRDSGGKIEWSESFLRGAEKVEIGASLQLLRGDLGWRLTLNDYLYDWLELTDAENIARGLFEALRARIGQGVTRDELLDMLIPPDDASRADYVATVEMYRGTAHQEAIEAEVDRIDALVGPALGLNAADLAAIREDMLTDPFLKNIVPRWPGSTTRLHGYRTGLDSSERYA